MRRFLGCIILCAILSFSAPVSALGPITVLLARTVGVSDTDAREMLDQINDLANNSDIDGLGGFVSASFVGVLPEVHVVTGCVSTDGATLARCARTKLAAVRTNKSADIALLMVAQDIASDCGSVIPEMINAFTISQANADLAYAVIEKGCFNQEFNGQVVASHEVGHLLSIEHVDGDQHSSLPVSLPALSGENHAMENVFDNATAVASAGDCLFGCEWSNFFSDENKDFSSVPFDDAGDADHSDAVATVQSVSWGVVAAYRPIPQVGGCSLRVEFNFCSGNTANRSITASLPGQSVINADYDWSYNGTGWFDLFEGALSCPSLSLNSAFWGRAILTTLSGQTSTCTIQVGERGCNNNPNPF